jgi:nucleoside-diphosphate-sugar epimerase
MNKQPLTIYGSGKQTRSFQYIDDLLEGLEKLIESNINEPVNLGNPYEEVTMLQLANEILIALDVKDEYSIEFKELPSDDPKVRKPNIQKAITELNWSPKITLKEGIKKIYDYLCINMTI